MTPEIRAFEYAAGLFSVLIGLAVVDIATSFHRLLRSKAAVRWDPLALLGAVYALCLVVAMWFDLWGVRNVGATRYFLFYLSLIVQFFILFLVAAASLPDERDDGIDLREYYSKNRRYFWSLITLFQVEYSGIGLYFVRFDYGRIPQWAFVLSLVLMVAPLLVSVVLLCTKSRRVHYVGLALMLALMGLHYGPGAIN
jgi:hypothetical protein